MECGVGCGCLLVLFKKGVNVYRYIIDGETEAEVFDRKYKALKEIERLLKLGKKGLDLYRHNKKKDEYTLIEEY